MGIEEMHKRIAEASDKGKPTLRRILVRIRRCWTGCGRRGRAGQRRQTTVTPESLTAALTVGIHAFCHLPSPEAVIERRLSNLSEGLQGIAAAPV